MDWSCVDYFDVLSAVWTHFDGTHSLQRIHLWASDVMLKFSTCSDEETNSFTSWLVWQWAHFLQILTLGWITLNRMFSFSYPLGKLIGLVVFPHVVQDQIHDVRIRCLSVKRQTHQTGHPDQQSGNLQQLLPGAFHPIRPGVIYKKHTTNQTREKSTKPKVPDAQIVEHGASKCKAMGFSKLNSK